MDVTGATYDRPVAYSPSFPLGRWRTERRAAIDTLAEARAHIGELDGPGRPLEVGRPLAHAYVVRVVAEFQAFTRDLHDLAAAQIVTGSGAAAAFQPVLIAAATEGRGIDRGNAGMRTLPSDFRRFGLRGLNGEIGKRNAYWIENQQPPRHGDKAYYEERIRLRNAVAHGNQTELDELRGDGVLDTVTWARLRLPGLGRMASAMDRTVWDHLTHATGNEPW
jgi:hypothetical protein